MKDLIEKCETNMNFQRLYRTFQRKSSFLFIGEEQGKMLSAIKEIAAYFDIKVISLDIRAHGESLFKGEKVIVTEGTSIPYYYTDLPYWVKKMKQQPENKYVLVLEHFEEATPRMQNWIKRLARDANYDRQDIGEFFVAALYERQSADEDVEKAIGSAVYSVFWPRIEWEIQ